MSKWTDEGCFEKVVVVEVVLIRAMLFGGPLLDEYGSRPFFLFPHRRERWIRRHGKVVEWVEHSPQNVVLHIEDHGCL